MSSKSSLTVFLVLVVIAFTAYFVGCTTKAGFKQGAKTAARMDDAQTELLAAESQTEATTTALNEFGKQEGIDLPTQFKEFGKAIDSMESQFGRARKSVTKVNEQGNKFFLEWDNEIALITNEDIRQRMETRKTNLLGSFSRIDASMQQAEAAYGTFMSDLRDVERFLSIDLTPGGIAAVSDTIQKTNADSATLQKQIEAVIEELARVAPEMPEMPSK